MRAALDLGNDVGRRAVIAMTDAARLLEMEAPSPEDRMILAETALAGVLGACALVTHEQFNLPTTSDGMRTAALCILGRAARLIRAGSPDMFVGTAEALAALKARS